MSSVGEEVKWAYEGSEGPAPGQGKKRLGWEIPAIPARYIAFVIFSFPGALCYTNRITLCVASDTVLALINAEGKPLAR